MSANRTVDRLDPVGDGALAAAEPRDDRRRQDVVEQGLGPALLGIEPVEVMALAVAQALALEGRADPGAQDGGSNGFR